MKRVVFCFLAACPLFAGEYAVLQNGFRIRADRHELVADKTRLHIGSGTMELPTGDIRTFEVEEYVRPTSSGGACKGRNR